MEPSFWNRHHKKIIWAVVLFSLGYLAIHFVPEADEFKGLSLLGWMSELGEHFWHIAPVVIVFLIFAGIEIANRIKSRKR